MEDVEKLNKEVKSLNVKVEVANAHQQHISDKLDEIAETLKISAENTTRLFTGHEVRISKLDDKSGYHQKKIDLLQSQVKEAKDDVIVVDRRVDNIVNRAIGWSSGLAVSTSALLLGIGKALGLIT